MSLRVLVTGGRDFNNMALVRRALADLPEDAVLVHGAASGADSLTASQWVAWGRRVEAHPANWGGPCRETCKPGHRRSNPDRCPAAGPYRNQDMLDSGVDMVIAFPGRRGTADMVRKAQAADVPVLFASELTFKVG